MIKKSIGIFIVTSIMVNISVFSQEITKKYKINYEFDSTLDENEESFVNNLFKKIDEEIIDNGYDQKKSSHNEGQIILPLSSLEMKEGNNSFIESIEYSDFHKYFFIKRYNSIKQLYTYYLFDNKTGVIIRSYIDVLEIKIVDKDSKVVIIYNDRWEEKSINDNIEIFKSNYESTTDQYGKLNGGIKILNNDYFLIIEGKRQNEEGQLFSIRQNKIEKTFKDGDASYMEQVKISFDKRYLGITGTQKSLETRYTIIYDLKLNQEVLRLKNSFFQSWATKTNKFIFSNKNNIREYDLTTSKETLKIELDRYGEVSYCKNDSMIAVSPEQYAFESRTIIFYDCISGKINKEIPGSSFDINPKNYKYFIVREFDRGDNLDVLYDFNSFSQVLKLKPKEKMNFTPSGQCLIMNNSIIELKNSKIIASYEKSSANITYDEEDNLLVTDLGEVFEFFDISKKIKYFLYANNEGWLIFDSKKRYDCSQSFSDRIYFSCDQNYGNEKGVPDSYFNKKMKVPNLWSTIKKGLYGKIIAPVINDCNADQSNYNQGIALLDLPFKKPSIDDYEMATANFIVDSENQYVNLKNYSGKRIRVLHTGVMYTCDIWNSSESNLLFTYYVDYFGGFMALTPDGYFTSTSQFHGKVVLSINDTLVEFSQLNYNYYRPDILNGILSTNILKNRKNNISNGIATPPIVEINFLKNSSNRGIVVEADNDSKDIQLSVKAVNMGGGIKNIQIFNNGKIVNEINPPKGLLKDTLITIVTLDAIIGKNEIQAFGTSDDNTQSMPASLIYDFDPKIKKESKPNMYIVAIGIDNYKNIKYNLKYCTKDMNSFCEGIHSVSTELFDSIYVNKIENNNATRENVLNALANVSSLSTPEDVFIFFYAGHGIGLENNETTDFYFITHGVTQMTNIVNSSANGISGYEIKDYLKRIKANKQILFLDACNSGTILDQFVGARGVEYESSISKLSRSAGVYVFAATTNTQTAKEYPQLNHGAFTYVLLQAFKGISRDDCEITASGLDYFINIELPKVTKKYKGTEQYPTTFKNGQDFPIGHKCKID